MANQTDSSAQGGGADVNAEIAALKEALQLERAKNEVLLAQVLKSEDGLADRDVQDFGDVIPNEDRGWWRGMLVENRDGTLGMLKRMRERLANRGNPARPGTGGAEAASLPRPLHNRAFVRPAAGGGSRPSEADQAVRAARLRNRAGEIAQRDGIPFTMAFSLAEREAGK